MRKLIRNCESQYYIAVYNRTKPQKNIPLWLCQHEPPPEQQAGIFPQAAKALRAHRAFSRCAVSPPAAPARPSSGLCDSSQEVPAADEACRAGEKAGCVLGQPARLSQALQRKAARRSSVELQVCACRSETAGAVVCSGERDRPCVTSCWRGTALPDIARAPERQKCQGQCKLGGWRE